MTREAFQDKWRAPLLGMALTGLVLDQDERPRGPHSAGQRALALPEKIDKLVAQIWADAQTAESPKPTGNGTATLLKREAVKT